MKAITLCGTLFLASAMWLGVLAQDQEKSTSTKKNRIKITWQKDGKTETIDETFEGEMPAELKARIEKMESEGKMGNVNINVQKGSPSSGKTIVIKHVAGEEEKIREVSGDEPNFIFFEGSEEGGKKCEWTEKDVESLDSLVEGAQGARKEGTKIMVFRHKKEGKEGEKRTFTKTIKVIVLREVKIEDVKETDEMPPNARVENAKTFGTEMQDLQVYPNPAENGRFSLKFKLENEGNTDIKIYDLKGKMAYQENIGNFKGTYDKQIQVPDLQEGMYILQIVQGEKVLTKKLVVQ